MQAEKEKTRNILNACAAPEVLTDSTRPNPISNMGGVVYVTNQVGTRR